MHYFKILGYLNLISAILSILLANLVASRPRTFFNSMLHQILNVGAFLSLFYFLGINANTKTSATYFYAFTSVGWALLPIFFYYLIKALVGEDWKSTRRGKIPLIALLPGFLLIAWEVAYPEKSFELIFLAEGYAIKYLVWNVILVNSYYLVYALLAFYQARRFLQKGAQKDLLFLERKKILNFLLLVFFVFLFIFVALEHILSIQLHLAEPLIIPLVSGLTFFYSTRLKLTKGYTQFQLEYEQFRLLSENTKALLEVDELDELIKIIAENARKASGAIAVAVSLVENENSRVKYLAGLDNPIIRYAFNLAKIDSLSLIVPVTPGRILWQIVHQKSTVLVQDCWEALDQIIPSSVAHLVQIVQKIAGVQVIVNVPLIVDGEGAGIVSYSMTKKVNQAEIKFLEMFTAQASQAFKKVKLLNEVKKANQELEQRVIERTQELEQARAELRQYAHHLEEEVERRTQELKQTHERLVDLARQAGRAEVASGVLHNIGNALNTIFVRLQRMEELAGQLDPSHCKNLLSEWINPQRLRHLISNEPEVLGKLYKYLQLKFDSMEEVKARVEANFLELKRRVDYISEIISLQKSYAQSAKFLELFSINQIVQDAVSMMSESISKRKIWLELEPGQDLPMVRQNRNQLLQVFMNLIKNAIEALEPKLESERWIKIITSQKEENKIEVEIQDNGAGISQEELDQIFQYGFTTKPYGQGLGLPVSVNFLQSIGGDIQAETKGKGVGAIFRVIIPIEPKIIQVKEVA